MLHARYHFALQHHHQQEATKRSVLVFVNVIERTLATRIINSYVRCTTRAFCTAAGCKAGSCSHTRPEITSICTYRHRRASATGEFSACTTPAVRPQHACMLCGRLWLSEGHTHTLAAGLHACMRPRARTGRIGAFFDPCMIVLGVRFSRARASCRSAALDCSLV